jgi:putative hydrolase of HD superfamily
MAKTLNLDLCEEKLLKLALVHDLGEIEAGDTFLYANDRDDARKEERLGVKRIENHVGHSIPNLLTLWRHCGASKNWGKVRKPNW